MGRYLNFNGEEINSKLLSNCIVDTIKIINEKYKKGTDKDFLAITKSKLLDSIVYTINNPNILIEQINKLLSREKDTYDLIDELYNLNFEWHEFNGNKEEYEKHWKTTLYEDIGYINNLFKNHKDANRIKIYWNL